MLKYCFFFCEKSHVSTQKHTLQNVKKTKTKNKKYCETYRQSADSRRPWFGYTTKILIPLFYVTVGAIGFLAGDDIYQKYLTIAKKN